MYFKTSAILLTSLTTEISLKPFLLELHDFTRPSTQLCQIRPNHLQAQVEVRSCVGQLITLMFLPQEETQLPLTLGQTQKVLF